MVCSVAPGPWGSWMGMGEKIYSGGFVQRHSALRAMRNLVIVLRFCLSCFRILESLCCLAWYWRSHALRLAVGWRSLSISDSEKVKVCLLPGMEETLLYALVICVWMFSLLSAWDVAWSTPCRWEFLSIHWLYVYSWRLCITVLVQLVVWKGLCGCLWHMKAAIVIPHCELSCPSEFVS